MSARAIIVEEAKETAGLLERQTDVLRHDLKKIEARKTELETQLTVAKLCYERIATFEPEIGGNLQCPRCWIYNNVRSTMQAILSPRQEDVLKCDNCNLKSPLYKLRRNRSR
jgi:hypothetical protein